MGELGLMINCWLFKGEIPLVSVGLGALLKGGFPNPSWCYGKMKAKYKLLGGLIKGSTTVELKVGEVCVPEFGNPLDDIRIFEDMSPGSEDDLSEGWSENNVVSPLSTPRFTTNMVMDDHIRILDKNIAYSMANYDEELEKYTEQASRTYVFHLDPTMQLDVFADPDPDADPKKVSPTSVTRVPYTTVNHMAYALGTGTMSLNTGYRVTLSGYAKEIVNGKEVDPIFKDSTTNWKEEHKEWRDTVVYYYQKNCHMGYHRHLHHQVSHSHKHLHILLMLPHRDTATSCNPHPSIPDAHEWVYRDRLADCHTTISSQGKDSPGQLDSLYGKWPQPRTVMEVHLMSGNNMPQSHATPYAHPSSL